MTVNVGTYSIDDLQAVRFQSAKALGLNTIAQTLQADLANHNAIVEEMLRELCEVGTDARRIYGTSAAGEMIEVDEYGAAASQKNVGGVECGFPLRLYQYNLGWTRKFIENAKVGDLVQGQLNAQKAHMQEIQRQIRRAVFRATNYTFVDFLVDSVALPVRRFINADSLAIPDGPNGETFDGAAHTHFTAAAALAVADLQASISNVVEHGHGGAVKLAISQAQETAVRALVGFVPYIDPRLIVPGGATSGVPSMRLDISRLDNRAIGILDAAEVWVKPWVPDHYYFVYDTADGQKPLFFRQRASNSLQGLRLAAEYDSHPLQAQMMEAEFGIGVWTRTNGACHFDNGAAWADAV